MTSHKLDIIIEQMSLAGFPIFTPPFCGAGVSEYLSTRGKVLLWNQVKSRVEAC